MLGDFLEISTERSNYSIRSPAVRMSKSIYFGKQGKPEEKGDCKIDFNPVEIVITKREKKGEVKGEEVGNKKTSSFSTVYPQNLAPKMAYWNFTTGSTEPTEKCRSFSQTLTTKPKKRRRE